MPCSRMEMVNHNSKGAKGVVSLGSSRGNSLPSGLSPRSPPRSFAAMVNEIPSGSGVAVLEWVDSGYNRAKEGHAGSSPAPRHTICKGRLSLGSEVKTMVRITGAVPCNAGLLYCWL